MRKLLAALSLVAACSADMPDSGADGVPPPIDVRTLALRGVRTALSRTPSQLAARQRSDGIKELQIMAGFQHATMIVRAADGSRYIECADDAERAAELLEKGLE